MTGADSVGMVMDENWFRRPEEMQEDELLKEILHNTRRILQRFDILSQQEEETMTDISGLTSSVNADVAAQQAASTALDDLAAQVAKLTAGNIPQSTIDALKSSLDSAQAALSSSVSKDDPAPAPAPTPTPGPVSPTP